MLSDFKNRIIGSTQGLNVASVQSWNAKQTYIALGFGLAAAALENIDATPMEGFNPTALDELLELPQKGLRSVLMLPLGYRDEANDWLAKMAKVRRADEKLFVRL
jgi:nitroreductase